MLSGDLGSKAHCKEIQVADFSEILYEVKTGVAFVTLNRPDKRNALNDQLLIELRQAINAAEAKALFAVLLSRMLRRMSVRTIA